MELDITHLEYEPLSISTFRKESLVWGLLQSLQVNFARRTLRPLLYAGYYLEYFYVKQILKASGQAMLVILKAKNSSLSA